MIFWQKLRVTVDESDVNSKTLFKKFVWQKKETVVELTRSSNPFLAHYRLDLTIENEMKIFFNFGQAKVYSWSIWDFQVRTRRSKT